MSLKRHLDDDASTESTKRQKTERTEDTTDAYKSKFIVCQLKNFDLNFPFFRQPKEIGFLSLDINRKFRNDKSQLKYYIEPPDMKNVQFDLKIGYKEMIRKDENSKEYINDVLRWIIANLEKFTLHDSEQINKAINKSDDSRTKQRLVN